MYCEQCGAKNEEGAKFCTSCGATIGRNGGEQENIVTEKAEKSYFSFTKKLIIAVITIIFIGGGGLLGYNFISKNFSSDKNKYENYPLIYIKDESLLMRNQNAKESYKLADNARYTSYPQLSLDGKTIFFADDTDDNYGFDLYYRKTNQKIPKGNGANKKGIKIDSGVQRFKVSPKGDFVVYLKSDRLYISDLKDKRSISKDVKYFWLSEDSKKIIFENEDNYLYICGIGKKDTPEKIDKEIDKGKDKKIDTESDSPYYSYASYYVELNNKIYYTKENDLYCKEYGKDKVKVTTEVASAFTVNDSLFITKEVKVIKKFDEIFNDDCASTDSQIQMLEPSYSDFKVSDEDGNIKTDWDAYFDAYDEYTEKKERNEVRDYYKKYDITVLTYTLYKVNGTKIQEIEKDMLNKDGRILKKQASEDSKINMSTVTSLSDAKSKIDDFLNNVEFIAYILKANGKKILIADYNKDNFENITISDNEKYLYCEEKVDSDNTDTLNRYTITNSGLTSKEKICDDVSDYVLLDNEAVIVHLDDKKLGIYENGKYTQLSDCSKLSDRSNRNYQYEAGVLYFYDEYVSYKEVGNLMRYKNGKITQVDTDVYDFVIRGPKECYYIKDYNKNKESGELYQNTRNKPKLIDSDVSSIIY